MESCVTTKRPLPAIAAGEGCRWIADERPLEECRSLLGIVKDQIENLARECRADRTKEVHLRELGTALSALADRINRMDPEPRDGSVVIDNCGNTYRSVRACDIDRFIDK